MSSPKVVVIGAGVVGAALADELSARGWDDIAVIDAGPIPMTGGSSSHAPGVVFQANSSKTMTQLARYTVEKYCSLDADGQPCFLQTGGLEVATTPARLAELHRRLGWLSSWGVAGELLTPAQCLSKFGLLAQDLVLGGLFVPTDGVAKALRGVQAQLTRATRRGGVRLLAEHRVTDIVTEGGRVRAVVTEHGVIPADIVVCCAGIWGPVIAGMVGMALPLTPLAHQLAWTAPIPALAGQRQELARPVLRHQDHDLYFRDDFDCLGVGFYGHRPMPVAASDLNYFGPDTAMPSVQDFTPSDFEPAWRETQRILPCTKQTEIADAINGVFSFTTDGMPLMGESPDVAGFWVAEAVWVTHSAGVGRAMAEWLIDGYCSSFDLHECDVNRFEAHQLAPDYVVAKDCQNFVEVYDILHPLQPMEQLRPIRVSPFYARQQELGAVFLEASGWERPQWYEANTALLTGAEVSPPDEWAARYWSPIVAAEARETRQRVAMFDMTALKRLEVSGPGAEQFLQRVTTGDAAKSVGSVTYCLLLESNGGIRSDVTVARLGDQRFQVGANSELDVDWLRRQAAGGSADSAVRISDITAGTCCIGLWGPRARDVMSQLGGTDFSAAGFGYFRAKETYLGTVQVTAIRLSYVGELGWELYTTADQGRALWDLLWRAGQPFGVFAGGRAAFNSLRMEKGYRSFGTDMTFEHDPYEAGLGLAVSTSKPDFVGKEALAKRKDAVARKLACLSLTKPGATVLGKEPVFLGGSDACVGYVTSAAYGHTVGCGIAYAWLPTELSAPGTSVDIGYFDDRLGAVVVAEPLFDPGMTRLRG